eukprot:502392-Pelagomonas_calceolata.AAC.3
MMKAGKDKVEQRTLHAALHATLPKAVGTKQNQHMFIIVDRVVTTKVGRVEVEQRTLQALQRHCANQAQSPCVYNVSIMSAHLRADRVKKWSRGHGRRFCTPASIA